MSTAAKTDARRVAIAALQIEAGFLLESQLHESMKAQVRLAKRDLEEALTWLNQENAENREPILMVVDLATGFGRDRLMMVKDGIEKYGPRVMLVG